MIKTEDQEPKEAEIFACAIFPQTIDSVQDFEGCLDSVYHACVFREGCTRETTNFTAIYQMNTSKPRSKQGQSSIPYEFLHGTQLGEYMVRNFSVDQSLSMLLGLLDVTMNTYHTEFSRA